MECCGLDGSSEIIPITNVTAILKEEHYKDSARLIRVLQSHGAQKTGPFYLVKGTCDQLDDLSVQLSAALKHRAGSDSGRSDCQQKQDSVSVSAFVMNYIQHKCSKELDRIAGSRFIIEIQPDASTATREGRRMLLVTFRPRNPSESQLHAHFVRQRFIVFYQKTASNLMTIYPPVSLSDSQELQRSFPELLFDSSWDRPGLTLTGNFAQVDLFGKCQKLLGCRDQTTISTSSANRREHEAESCPICLENIDVRKKQTLKCKHSFCSECLKRAFGYKPVCPACGKVYGVLMGTQPEGGQMSQATREASLPGYEQHGTIVIHYCIPSGIQQEEHPNPGEPYSGVSREAFLPDSPEGRRVAMLLRKAFNQRLIFTVGHSTSTSRNNTVTWNDIHHKTSVHGGPTNYGYPDPDYLRRVVEELAAKGVQ